MVTRRGQNRTWYLARLTRGPVLVGAMGTADCGEPGQGTVQVTPETHQRLAPHVDSKAKGRLQKVAGKSLSIKDRTPASPSQ